MTIPERRVVPLDKVSAEIMVINSRFIGIAGSCTTPDEAWEFIKAVKSEYPQASHYVPAFIIGHGNSVISHSSDAGEPSGTAGRPVMAVVQGSGLGDIIIVVVRYFGGTKLGTGGLVRAYTQAAQAVLENVQKAVKVDAERLEILVDYRYFERVVQVISENWHMDLEREFSEIVSIRVSLMVERVPAFIERVQEITNGQAVIEQIGFTRDVRIPMEWFEAV